MTKLTQRVAMIVSSITLLSACGGDSGSTTPSSAIVPPVTVPSPSAPPATQPPSLQYTPAPAPVVPLTFDETFDVTAIGGFSFRGINYVDIFGINQFEVDQMRALASTTMPRFIWSQTAQRMRLENIGPATEYGATQTEQTNNFRIFSDQPTRLVIGWTNPTRYAKIATWSRRIGAISWEGLPGEESQAFWALIGNTSTIAWDTSRTLRYEGTAFTAPSDLQIRPLDFSAFPRLPGDNRVSGGMEISRIVDGKLIFRGSLRFEGTFNIVTNRFTGEITDPVGGFKGTFDGAVFGPNHDEVGIIFSISRAIDGGKVYSGIGIGTRYFL